MIVNSITQLSEDVDDLIQQSRRYQEILYPPESINQDDPHYLINGGMYFIGAYDSEKLCGIGGVKIMHDIMIDDGYYGEIKNLFVDPDSRGRGASKMIMNSLENYLIKKEVKLCRLETGVSQPESIGLYQRLGYRDCQAYGDYADDPLSVFMEKTLTDLTV